MATASCMPSSRPSPLEVGRRIVPTHFDAFRLHVAPSYREVFDRAVQKVLAQQGWQIVKVSARAQKRSPRGDLPLSRRSREDRRRLSPCHPGACRPGSANRGFRRPRMPGCRG